MISTFALLALVAQSSDPAIAGVIAAVRSFDQRLPNFICKQVTTRYVGETNDGPWKQTDTFAEQLTYFNRKESHKVISINGKAVDNKRRPGRGLQANSMFGGMLQHVFREESKAVFERNGEDTIDGRKVIRLRYRVARENSKWTTRRGGKIYVRAFSGNIWADANTLDVLRLTGQIEPETGDPAWLGGIKTDLRYGFVKVGEQEHLLPVRSEIRLEVDKKPRKNVIEFSEFKQYTTETKIEFGDPK